MPVALNRLVSILLLGDHRRPFLIFKIGEGDNKNNSLS